MKSITVDFILVFYGNCDSVPDLTDKDAPLFINWYLEALESSASYVNIELISGSSYYISWDDKYLHDELTLIDPDPYGSYPFDLNGHRFMVIGQIIS